MIKAKAICVPGRKSEKVEKSEIRETKDDLIMVLFPRYAWEAAQKLTEEHGSGSVGETISYALKLLDETLKKQKG